ncbi:serine-threonine protein kinase, putative [Entamoeba invadens IP1]|uniref:serine-threonine protein kinase, putative n=1 Tax=Entamoeba invadens IP1 TaxID=370355 RepID=UPI0002C3F1A5|nr:serine-threonine protein kinase, putative [Entamoeba invadens IP1]ELP90568.1 serine-threonine protein kinase, putative [Entamoeba invadens IP1]|eukprot:XP_004257339.1 serine-threonine protein kinase, putative [Entamoeba invadens IP1]
MFLIIIYIIVSSDSLLCSPGCINGCLFEYTCLGCTEGYDNDTSCLNCALENTKDRIYYIKNDSGCIKATQTVLKARNKKIPDTNYITEIDLVNDYNFTLDLNSFTDYGFCYYTQRTRLGKWFSLDITTITDQYIVFKITKSRIDVNVDVDVTNSPNTSEQTECFMHTKIDNTMLSFDMTLPIIHSNNIYSNTGSIYYFFVSMDNTISVDVTIKYQQNNSNYNYDLFNFTQHDADVLSSNLSSILTWKVPLEQKGITSMSVCFPFVTLKSVPFSIQFTGNYSLLLNATQENRMNFIQQYDITFDDSGLVNLSCLRSWEGRRIGVLGEEERIGTLIQIKGSDKKQLFSLLSKDQKSLQTIQFRVICPNDCNFNTGHGVCSANAAKCVCSDKYGGDDCHLKCYYNRTWTVEDNTNSCKFGSHNCDQYCQCESGYTLINHLCVSDLCIQGKYTEEMCVANTEGCDQSCHCESDYEVTRENKCKHKMCGNGRIDTYYDEDNHYIRKEECDGGHNCVIDECKCANGYITEEGDPLSCKKKVLSSNAIVGIVVGGAAGFVLVLFITIIIIYFTVKLDRIDTNTLKQRQPQYHYYISGSSNFEQSKKEKYLLKPTNLDFGNVEQATEIFDTRYQKIEVKNYSKTKYLMIIFHAPLSPKYIFHFEPQVLFISPHSTIKTVTVYMTLFTTTKIRNLKIPYTVWLSKNKHVLIQIAELLKDKTFEEWTSLDQKSMEELCNKVALRSHYSFTITTDAACSTHIDLDELGISEKPFAEGAMGNVFIGNYRSVPVAIKQFKWESLTDTEMDEMKKEVMYECDMMSKLRNPFIANYIGSVTYLPQVSMVIQYFVLGSLSEYLREDKEFYFKLPYKLKVRMLYDTARGMQFLHENKIMHLDLKPDNLLVNSLDSNSACTIKITDFGTSRFLKKTKIGGEDKGLGTPIYASPESYQDEYTFAGDVYSFGVTAWEMYYQEEPFKDFKSLFEIKQFVVSGKRLEIDEKMPKDYAELVEECWRNIPTERPTFNQVTKILVEVDNGANNENIKEEDTGCGTDETIESIVQKKMQRMKDQLKEIANDY